MTVWIAQKYYCNG